jgi:hypothetical protein
MCSYIEMQDDLKRSRQRKYQNKKLSQAAEINIRLFTRLFKVIFVLTWFFQNHFVYVFDFTLYDHFMHHLKILTFVSGFFLIESF